MFNVCESHRRFFFSLTDGSVLCHVNIYTAPSSGAVAPTEMKVRSLFLACWVFCAVWTSVFWRRVRATLVVGSTVSQCGGFFSFEARAVGTWV